MGMQCKAQSNSQQTAGIGCFSIIIIGLMIFYVGRWSNGPMREDIETLSAQVEALTEQNEALQTSLDEFRYEVRAIIAVD